MARRKAGRDIESYAHTDKERVNNPPVGLVTPETDRDAAAGLCPRPVPLLGWQGRATHLVRAAGTVAGNPLAARRG